MRTRRAPGVARFVLAATCAAVVVGCGSDAPSGEPRILTVFPDAAPGDLIALRASDADPEVVEWIDRRAGTIGSIDTTASNPEPVTIAVIEIGTDGAQRGLLGHTVIDGVRYAAWTEPGNGHLVVGALTEPADGAPATVDRIVWDAGGTAGGAVGGHLERTLDGQLVLGIGQLTDWAKANGSGAMLQLDSLGPPDQTPIILSEGYINPFAFTVTTGLDEPTLDGQLWVADNAVGNDVERIGRGDAGAAFDDRADHDRTGGDPRAPSAMVALPDGRLAICGFLDGRLQAWQPDELLAPSTTGGSGANDSDARDPDAGGLVAGDDLGPCLTGVALLDDGTLVTATADALVAIAP